MKHQVYPRPNRALVKAIYDSYREHLISLAEFADLLRIVMGKRQ